MKIITRQIENQILASLKSFPVVYINGPRQAGKTTLVHTLLAEKFPAKFITFDDVLERSAVMRNPYIYIKESGTPLIIDEVQMAPDMFRSLKKLVDEQRLKALENGVANGNYLLTGSANLLAIPELANAMVGRMATLTLLPFSVSEILGKKPHFLEKCFNKDFSEISNKSISITDAMQKATYPELASMPENMIFSWFRNYIQKITLEDPRHLYNLEKAEYMPALLQALAARAGSLINDADIGRDIGLNAVTTRQYRSLLEQTFITNTLKPWHRNITKRLVKSHKLYFQDVMLLCHILRSTPAELAKNQPGCFGHVLENFVLSEICKANYATGEKFEISFYRTNDGREVDFVLEYQQKIIAIEVKYTESITEKHLSGLRELQQITQKDFHVGIILCNTQRVIAYDDNIYLVPLSALWE